MYTRVRAAWSRRGWFSWRRPLGIRAQLTVFYTAIFALLFLVVASAYFVYLDRTLQANFDATLATRTAQIASGISFENGALNVQDVTGELPQNAATPGPAPDGAKGSANADGSSGAAGTGSTGSQVDVAFGTLVRVLDQHGATVYVSPGFRSLRVPASSVTTALRGSDWLGSVATADRSDVRVASVPLRDNGHIYGVLQVGASATGLHATLDTAAVALFGVAPLLLLLGAAGSYWLARRALEPVLRLTSSAREIEAADLHRRVPVPRAHDEIQDLALTLNGMIARLERAFEQQRRFVADASHELRTPVAAIQSLTDVALAQPGSVDDTAQVLRAVNGEAHRLGVLIGELLALARADEGAIPLEHDLVRVDLLANEVVSVVEPLAAERGVRLELRAAPATVRGDEARLMQALLNVLDNAVRYTPAGGEIAVAVDALETQVRLVVRDTGRGIAPEHLPHIFERFYRADPARTREDGGSGLGLSIVDWIVRAHAGTVSVESQVGEGTTVTILLPHVPSTDVPALPPPRSRFRRSHRPRTATPSPVSGR